MSFLLVCFSFAMAASVSRTFLRRVKQEAPSGVAKGAKTVAVLFLLAILCLFILGVVLAGDPASAIAVDVIALMGLGVRAWFVWMAEQNKSAAPPEVSSQAEDAVSVAERELADLERRVDAQRQAIRDLDEAARRPGAARRPATATWVDSEPADYQAAAPGRKLLK